MLVAYREFPPNRRFGVELEVSPCVDKDWLGGFVREYESQHGREHDVKVTSGKKGWAESRKNSYWHVKYDSTCGPLGKGFDHGWEVASYIGIGIKDAQHISGLGDWLNYRNVCTNNNCGLHIHVEAKDISQNVMGIILARWIKVEKVLTYICPQHRWNNQYCQSLFWRSRRCFMEYDPDYPYEFWRAIRPYNLETHCNDEKKYTLNTVGYTIGTVMDDYDRQTIELRLPECLLSTEHILNWLRLVVNFVERASVATAPLDIDHSSTLSEFLDLIGLGSYEYPGKFLIFDDQLLDTKIWILNKIKNSEGLSEIFRSEAGKCLDFISKI